MKDENLAATLLAVSSTEANADVLLAMLACVKDDDPGAPYHALGAVAAASGADKRVRASVLRLCSANAPVASQIAGWLLSVHGSALDDGEAGELVELLEADTAARTLEGIQDASAMTLDVRLALARRGCASLNQRPELLTGAFDASEHGALLRAACEIISAADGDTACRDATVVASHTSPGSLRDPGRGAMKLAMLVTEHSASLSEEDIEAMPVVLMRCSAEGNRAMAERLVAVLGDDPNAWLVFQQLAGKHPVDSLGSVLAATIGAIKN